MENVIESILEVLDAQLANCIKAGARFYSGHDRRCKGSPRLLQLPRPGPPVSAQDDLTRPKTIYRA